MNSDSSPVGAMERNDGIRSILLRASVYRLAQRLLGADKSSTRLASEVIRSGPNTVVVDIGCGTADIADYIEFGSYVGFDPNQPYVDGAAERLRDRFGDRVKIFKAGVGDKGLTERLPARVDLAIMMGVLHHLDDQLADEALRLAADLVADRGRFISFDPGWVSGQPRIAKALIARDRGQYVRTAEATEALLRRHFSDVTISVHHNFLSVPYTHLVAEAKNPG